MSDWAAAVRAVERVAVAMLGERDRPRRTSPLRIGWDDPPGARAVGVASFTTGMGPLLAAWCEAGDLEAPDLLAGHLRAQLAHGRARTHRIRMLLEGLAAPLGAAEIRPVVLKGAHTALCFFPEPGARPSADVDLFVPEARGPEMEEVLTRAGFRLERRQRRPTRSVWLPREEPRTVRSLELTHAWNPLTLDLHLSLERDFYGARRVRVPEPRRDVLEPIAGLPEPYRGFSGPWLMAYLSLHASEDLYNLQLLKLVELVLVGRSVPDPPALWEDASDIAEGWGALGDIYPAWALASRLAPADVPAAILRKARSAAPASICELVDKLTPGTAHRLDGIRFEDRLAGAATSGARVRRLLHMLVPDSVAGSPRELGRLYARRLYQLLRGRVRLGSDSPEDRE